MSILLADIQMAAPVLDEAARLYAAGGGDDPGLRETTATLQDALARFVDIAAHVDAGDAAVARLSDEDMDRIADHVLNLMGALVAGVDGRADADLRARLARAVAGTAVWLARAGARLERLEPAANAFAAVANGTRDAAELRELALLMEEVIVAAGPLVKADPAAGDPARPWRVMNLKWGIIATRSHDTELMQHTFDRMAEHIPADLANFFREGMDEMERVGYPRHVRDVVQAYHEQWSRRVIH